MVRRGGLHQSRLRDGFAARWGLASRHAGVNTITLEEMGAQTKWMLVARFDSFGDRDLTASMGFGQMVSMGLERMAEHLRTM
jgi:hypothetical protein